MPECENCGHRTDREVKFCVKCGSPSTQRSIPNVEPELPEPDTERPPQTETPKNQCPNCGQENLQENL